MWTPEQANQSIRTAHRNAVLADVAHVMAKTLPIETLADVLDCWLSIGDSGEHDSRTVDIAELLFGHLCNFRPDARELAVTR